MHEYDLQITMEHIMARLMTQIQEPPDELCDRTNLNIGEEGKQILEAALGEGANLFLAGLTLGIDLQAERDTAERVSNA